MNSIKENYPRKKSQTLDNTVIYSRDLASHNVKKNNYFSGTRMSCVKNQNNFDHKAFFSTN